MAAHPQWPPGASEILSESFGRSPRPVASVRKDKIFKQYIQQKQWNCKTSGPGQLFPSTPVYCAGIISPVCRPITPRVRTFSRHVTGERTSGAHFRYRHRSVNFDLSSSTRKAMRSGIAFRSSTNFRSSQQYLRTCSLFLHAERCGQHSPLRTSAEPVASGSSIGRLEGTTPE